MKNKAKAFSTRKSAEFKYYSFRHLFEEEKGTKKKQLSIKNRCERGLICHQAMNPKSNKNNNIHML
ncbi:CLUMA_CG021646, isoform A [Clunio marinus]|uniref:CLUMA_CG021646, isoform A n=1 Tax=Clunio marinus TaxID=568069 RepID=A0A1J1J9F7_9DIPT|nr:CLUMA_CG021646, isoform A [Clunio marinus]